MEMGGELGRQSGKGTIVTPNFVYIVLAAGASTRMGFDKATQPLAGTSPLARLANVLAGARVVVVASEATAAAAAKEMPDATVLVNDEPERGMTSSLRVANREIAPHAILGVLLADKPFVSRSSLEKCEAAFADMEFDLVFAQHDGQPGHPVYFGPTTRKAIDELPDGDTLRTLRDDERFKIRGVLCDDDQGVVVDLDTPEAWGDAHRQLLEMEGHRAEDA